ncbi:Inositol-tetrakisphosphate 1-kinase 2 [Linum perenne]
MRIGGEGKGEEVEEKEEDEVEIMESVSMSMQQHQQLQQVVVGYALTSKKKKSFLQPKLEVLARNKGISFIAIDLNKPLGDQGPFDIVIHKDYRQKHPEVTVIDPPNAIRHLSNRQSMLQYVADLKLSDFYGTVCIPRQMVIDRDPSSIAHEVSKAGLKLPLVAKPLLVDGTAKSHQLSLAYDEFSLSELEPPLVLQEFVNHGGVLFKIYIMGESIKVVRRFSLPNVTNCELEKVAGVMRFPRVSCAAASADEADLDPSVAELPPLPLLERLAKELRCQMGLRLFNIDMIREHGSKDVFYVIDINYFPGYGKMPDYEHLFTDFLLSEAQSKRQAA